MPLDETGDGLCFLGMMIIRDCARQKSVLLKQLIIMDKSDIKPGHLRRIKSLAHLSDDQLLAFLNYVELVEFAQAATLFQDGQPGDSMYLILQGQMWVSTQKKNSEGAVFLRTLEMGDAFGEIALITQMPRTATIEVAQSSVLIKITAGALYKLMAEQPAIAAQFLFHIARSLGGELGNLTTKLRARTEMEDLFS
ncbi:MAG: cyclic nucleotide-binding domain-containing protein [Verrucomicrobiota bacterium]